MELNKFVELAIKQIKDGVYNVNWGKDIIAGYPTSLHFKISFCFSDEKDKIFVTERGDSYMEFDVPIA